MIIYFSKEKYLHIIRLADRDSSFGASFAFNYRFIIGDKDFILFHNE